jgi:glucose-6-phosphate dehydrogenase assembly protein OpcA
VLNLMVYLSVEAALEEVNELLGEISSAHPCRVIVMFAGSADPDQDIEMFVSAHCISSSGSGGKNLCGEQVTLKARGRFTVELPSAAVPLLVPDLPVFLWWRDAPRLGDQTFATLMRAADRVVIDSADFRRPYDEVLALVALLEQRRGHAAISDLNWARLTSWRMLLASFYDVEEYREALNTINRVRIEYVPHDNAPEAIAPKALILAGWLVSRLGWSIAPEQSLTRDGAGANSTVAAAKEGRRIDIEFVAVKRQAAMQGWIARIELSAESSSSSPAAFVVLRSKDGRYLETEVIGGGGDGETRCSRTLVSGDASEAELLEGELEIICHDRMYEEAISAAAQMLRAE